MRRLSPASCQIEEKKVEPVTDFIFLGSKITADSDWNHKIKRLLLLRRKSMTNPRQHIKKQRHHFTNKGLYNQNSSSHVLMWELDHKKGWALKNWGFQIVVLEKMFQSPLDCKEIKPANPKGNQSWILIGRTNGETNAPIVRLPDAKNQLTGNTLILGKIEGRRKRGP